MHYTRAEARAQRRFDMAHASLRDDRLAGMSIRPQREARVIALARRAYQARRTAELRSPWTT